MSYLIEDLRRLRACKGLSDAAWALFFAELQRLLNDAEEGRLNFDEDGRTGIVCQTAKCPNVLEMRVRTTIDFDGHRWHLRLYFSEPASQARILLSLNLQWKLPGIEGLQQQDEHIAEANRRLENWL